MYYRLKDAYELRGWKRLPFAIRNRENGATEFLNKEKFLALLFCDGLTPTESMELSDPQKEYLDTLIEHQILEVLEEPKGLKPYQHYKKYPARFIRSVQWSITGKCNYRCRHCFMSAPEARLGELPFEELTRIADELAECGIFQLELTGGEPLVRKDFFDLVDYLIDRNFLIKSIYSNGALVTRNFLEELQKRDLKPVIVMSYDGTDWHDWLRGIPGAEEKVLTAFRLCQEMGFPTSSALCLHQHNKNSIQSSVRQLADLGVSSLKISRASSVGDWEKEDEDHKLSLEESYETYLDYIPRYFEDEKPLQLQIGTLFFCQSGSDPMIPGIKYPQDLDTSRKAICGHARSSMYISPEGDVLPCMPIAGSAIQNQFPNALQTSLKDILEDSAYMNLITLPYEEYLAHHPECAACEHKNACGGGCRGIALEYDPDNYLAIDPEACFFHKNGYAHKVRALIKQILSE